MWDTWGGISGLQTGMQLMYEYGVRRGRISLEIFASIMGEKAGEIFRLNNKGKIQIGYDADLVIFDPEKNWEITPQTLYYLNPISAFCGLKGKGLVEKTMVRGKLVYDQGRFSETPLGILQK